MGTDEHAAGMVIAGEDYEELLRLMTELKDLAEPDGHRTSDGDNPVRATAERAIELLILCGYASPEEGNGIPEGEICVTPVEVRALEPYRIWLRYDDGVEGEVDLSDVAGRGVFAAWEKPGFFSQVRIAPDGSIAWGDDFDLDICGDALYMGITGLAVEDMFPRWRQAQAARV